MSFFLNEVEVQVKKVMCGVGYFWGMVEEVGRVIVWFCVQGCDGVIVFVVVLDVVLDVDYCLLM